jgi:hypothetical protein
MNETTLRFSDVPWRALVCILTVLSCGCSAPLEAGEGDERTGDAQAALSDSCGADKIEVLPSQTSLPSQFGVGAIGQGNTKWRPNRKHKAMRPIRCPVPVSVPPPPARLVVFLPGCTNDMGPDDGPTNWKFNDFQETALAQGFHVIGLDYPRSCTDGPSLACKNDEACYGRYRNEVTYGIPMTTQPPNPAAAPDLENHRQDSIRERLKALLFWLQSPAGGDPWQLSEWRQFLVWDENAVDGFRPDYENIVFAGHSLGGEYAAFFANAQTVRRVVMMAAPNEGRQVGEVVDWLEHTETAGSKFFGMVHISEGVDDLGIVMQNWNELGMTSIGALDQGTWVFDYQEDMCTLDGQCGHGGVGWHNGVVIAGGTYAPRWRFMLGSP